MILTAFLLYLDEDCQPDHGAEGLFLRCTEIFLLIDQHHTPDFSMFNTAKLHCDAA